MNAHSLIRTFKCRATAYPSCLSAAAGGVLLAIMAVAALCLHGAAAQLCEDYYDDSCPGAYDIVKKVLVDAHRSDVRIFASLIRLHFHDCFVQVLYLHRPRAMATRP